jgi:GNAT superfamily N-acetyltransferase
MALIRPLSPDDEAEVISVYRDAVLSQAPGPYSADQVAAWANHARSDAGVAAALRRGYGLASCAAADARRIEAFALLDPADRLSLLYCRGRARRQGRATALVHRLEAHARQLGQRSLRTEASVLSRPLLERLGWTVEAEEEVRLGGVAFRRWRMIRELD